MKAFFARAAEKTIDSTKTNEQQVQIIYKLYIYIDRQYKII